MILLGGCEAFSRSRPTAPAPPILTAPADSSSTDGAAAVETPRVVEAGVDAAPKPEHVILLVHEDSMESTVEIDREGAFKIERRGEGGSGLTNPRREGDAGKDECSGVLARDVAAALWKGIDATAFAPTGSGAKPIAAPRGDAGKQARYGIIRMLADLSMTPADDAAARSLLTPMRAAIAMAERCTR